MGVNKRKNYKVERRRNTQKRDKGRQREPPRNFSHHTLEASFNGKQLTVESLHSSRLHMAGIAPWWMR